MPPSHGGLSFIWLFTLRTNEFRASPYHHLTYVFPVRPSASELACRSLNQNLPSVLDVDSLPGGQRGEAAAGEVKEITIYGILQV